MSETPDGREAVRKAVRAYCRQTSAASAFVPGKSPIPPSGKVIGEPEMLAMVEQVPGLEVLIFSGEEPGNVRRALQGENPGTRLHR